MILYYADQLYKTIEDQVAKVSGSGGRLQFIIGDLSQRDALSLFTKCNNLAHLKGLKLSFWLAEEYLKTWQDLGDLEGHFANGNLTQYRNQIEDGSILILVGTVHVSDKGSLADFYQCDGESLWKEAMHGSFSQWIKAFYAEYGFDGEYAEESKRLDRILTYLYETYSLSMVSDFLSSMPGEDELSVDTPLQLAGALLSHLGVFKMPDMSGFLKIPKNNKKKTFRFFATGAVEFFNYNMFLEPTSQKKYLKAVRAFREKGIAFAPDPFDSSESYLNALENYISHGDKPIAEEFMGADFVYLYDVILQAKPEKTTKKKNSLHKLSGSPVEVVLNAIWMTISEWRRQTDGRDFKGVSVTGVRFAHDLQMGGTESEIANEARDYLRRLLGGLDESLRDQVQIEKGDETLPVSFNLVHDEVATPSSKAAEPFFEFHVAIDDGEEHEDEDDAFFMKFAIRLPADHAYRQIVELFQSAKMFLAAVKSPCKIPVFHFEYFKELMMARDADEIRRVLAHCISACDKPEDFGTVLFSSETWNEPANKPYQKYYAALASAFSAFVEEVCEKGIFTALKLGHTPELFKAYHNAAQAYTVSDPALSAGHENAAILMRSFLVVDRRKNEDPAIWGVENYEPASVVTVLHPAMLEMLQSQIKFLYAAFSRLVSQELLDKGDSAFREEHWSYYVDMAEMKMPLTGLAVNKGKCFQICSVGDELIHRIGSISPSQKLAATRFLTRYDRVDDEEISDADLFRPSSESRHLFRIIREYYEIHLGARDGLSLAVYRNEDVQPILAAIDQFVRWLPDERKNDLALAPEDRPEKYSMRVVFFSESSDTSEVGNCLSQWQERIDDAEEKGNAYSAISFSVSHRIVRRDDGYKQFAKTILSDVDADIFLLYNFIKPDIDGCDFAKAEPFDLTQAEIVKFPILEQSQCAGQSHSKKYKRSQIVSNRQFRIATDHAELSIRLLEHCEQGSSHIVLATGDYAPWQNVIDAAHVSAEWVVCIDPLIDRALLALGTENAEHKRELIGFGSGVGLHGENNYTISTQKYTLAAIRKKLLASMKGVYHDGYGYRQGSEEQFEKIADCLLQEAKELAGISLIRSLGPSDYVRDFMAYSLMHRILPLDEEAHLCDRIFSIDAYRHWFDQASEGDRTHPDLFWLRADIDTDGTLKLDIKLIECKMAKTSDAHLEKAKAQILNGLKVLMEVFRPKGVHSFVGNGGTLEADRPDMRYWCLQLHRMIASSVRIPDPSKMGGYLDAMEKLASGHFTITWGGGVFTFWTDDASDEMTCTSTEPMQIGSAEIEVPVFESGSKFVYRLCANETTPSLVWGQSLQIAPVPGNDEMPERPQEEEPIPEDEVPFVLPQDDVHTVNTENDPGEGQSPADEAHPIPPVVDPQPAPAQTTTLPERILLGKTKEGKEVFWEFGHPKLNNRHFLIFGNSGMGKTYAIQAILCELGSKGQNSLIVDYTNGFLPNQLQEKTEEVLHPCQNVVKHNKLPINPFKKQSQDIGFGMPIEEGDIDVAKRVSSIFDSVYQMGDQQVSVLIDALKFGLETYKENMSLEKLMPILQGFLEDGVHPKGSVQTLANKLKPFIDEAPFKADSMMGWSELFSDTVKRCQVFQMVMIDRSTARILTEFILWDLWAFASSGGSEKQPRIVVLDEVQNLDQRLDSPLGKYLTEGRKFGLCVMAATQTLSNLKKDEQARLFQSGHKLFFRPADPEINQYTDFVAQAAGSGDKNYWRTMLTSLSKGECLSIGPVYNQANGKFTTGVFKIKITALEERGL